MAQRQFTLYLHLDVVGAFHEQEDIFANFSTFYRKALKSVTVPFKYCWRTFLLHVPKNFSLQMIFL